MSRRTRSAHAALYSHSIARQSTVTPTPPIHDMDVLVRNSNDLFATEYLCSPVESARCIKSRGRKCKRREEEEWRESHDEVVR